jgi:arginase family enzyme
MGLSLVALRCRTADRTPRAMRGVETLAPLLESRLEVEARAIGSPSEERTVPYDEDLRDSRGCLLEAGGQVDDALDGGRVPVLLAGDCSIGITTLPSALRHGQGIKVLWLDAHADYNTPTTTTSGYLGGMALAGACGEWDAGLTDTIASDRVVLAGVRELDDGERDLLGASGVTVIGASNVETLVAVKNALDGAPVYVHLDLDVIDPEHFPAQFPAPGGLHPEKLYDLAEAVVEDCELVGLEITAFEAPDDPAEHAAAAETAMRVVEPFLDRLPSDRQSKK